jgi:hypothetical protein
MKQINEVCEKYETSNYQLNKIQINFTSLEGVYNFFEKYGAHAHALSVSVPVSYSMFMSMYMFVSVSMSLFVAASCPCPSCPYPEMMDREEGRFEF